MEPVLYSQVCSLVHETENYLPTYVYALVFANLHVLMLLYALVCLCFSMIMLIAVCKYIYTRIRFAQLRENCFIPP